MPTIITHAFVAGVASKAVEDRKLSFPVFSLAALLSILPDADVIAFRLGIGYGHSLGHRGFFHSPFFAIILGVLCVFIFFREHRLFSKSWFKYLIFFSLVGTSHGLLDALTDGGMGIALLAPFDNTRYFLPWTPIPVSPISLKSFLSGWGLRIIAFEIVYIWMPATAALIMWFLVKRHLLYRMGAFARTREKERR